MVQNEEHIREEPEETAFTQGIDLFWVADLTPARGYMWAQGWSFLAQFPRAVGLGIHLIDSVVDPLHLHEDSGFIYTYRFHAYQVVNPLLNKAALGLSEIIQKREFQAYPIPASQFIKTEELYGLIYHKLAANLAGFEWIRKNCLLITPDYGPRVRFATVLTDAPSKAGLPISNRCGDCQSCVNVCPAKAFTGIPFNPYEPRETRFKAHLCHKYCQIRKESFLPRAMGGNNCGLCVYICPYGKKDDKKQPT